MRYYRVASSIYVQNCISNDQSYFNEKYLDGFDLKQSPEEWVKINGDASSRISTKSTSLGYVMRDTHGKPIGDCPILIAECLDGKTISED